MRLEDMYGATGDSDVRDVTGSFHCRQSVPSPCTGGSRSGHWSNHAYGYAIDLNPVENPYVGCGRVRDPRTRPYVDRSPLRKNGDAGRRPGVPLDWLGLGRRLDERHQGLHALLRQRPLTAA